MESFVESDSHKFAMSPSLLTNAPLSVFRLLFMFLPFQQFLAGSSSYVNAMTAQQQGQFPQQSIASQGRYNLPILYISGYIV